MRRILGFFVVAMLFAINAMAQPVPSYNVDPCINPLLANSKQSVTASISSATTTSLIAPVTNAPIYVCSFQIAHPGGTGTMALEYGTGATCGTGTTLIRAAFAYNTSAGSAMIDNYPPYEGTGLYVPASQRLCALSTGSITQVVTVTYVQPTPQ